MLKEEIEIVLKLSFYFVLLGLLILGAESVADGKRGGCGKRSDSVIDSANVEAHRNQITARERRVLEMQEEGSESREMPR
ncbi:hypothetical protein ACOSP7_006836 [Xanthoceras sorbifolium]